MKEREEDDVELFESGKDPAKAFEPPEEPFDFVPFLIEFFVVAPGIESVRLGRDHWNHVQVEHRLPRFIALIDAIHQQRQAFRHRSQILRQQPALRCIVVVAGRKGEDYGRSIIRGNHRNLGLPSAAGLTDGLRALFFNAPAPSGCTLTEVEHRAQMWIVEHEAGFPGDIHTGILGDSQLDQEKFENFANEAPCPALDPETGRCDVYEFRPMTCRVFGPPVRMGEGGALAHCELCFKGASTEEVAACEMTVPFDIEAELLEEIPSKGSTVVAFALLK